MDPLLDEGLCNPPGSAALSDTTHGTRRPADAEPVQTQEDDGASHADSLHHGKRVAAEVWRTAMAALAQQWPALPALLALGATERLMCAVRAGSYGAGTRWAAWLDALVAAEGSAAPSQRSGRVSPLSFPSPKRKRADAATQAVAEPVVRLWTPNPQQTVHLLKQCLTASASSAAAFHGSQQLLTDSVLALIAATRPQDDSRVIVLAQQVGQTHTKPQGSGCSVS